MVREDPFDELTYARINLIDNTLDDNSLEKRCPLDNGHFTGHGQYDLGTLDRLPLEIIHLVLVVLDLRTLTSFRRVNWRARSVLDQLREYCTIQKHAPNLLRGVLSIKSDQWITCTTLYDTLCTAECEVCGDFGGYVYILTARRVCFLCLSEHPNYLPIPFGRASLLFGIPASVLGGIPHMVSVPGTYSPNEKKVSRTQRLVDFRALHRIVGRSSSNLGVEAWNHLYGKSHHVRQPKEDRTSFRQRDRDRILKICARSVDAKSGNALRFVAIVQAPFLDPATQMPVSGLFCIACKSSHVQRPIHFRRRFIRKSFEEHLEQSHRGLVVNETEP